MITAVRDLPLVEYEHQLNLAFMEMEALGLPVDVEYTSGYLSDLYVEREEHAMQFCTDAGIKSVFSSKQVASALLDAGAELTHRTKTGAWSTDKEVLAELIGLGGEAGELAQHIQDAKSASSFKTKYVDKVLASLDENNRVHPDHKSIQARTARTSVGDPPLHQLPSRDNPGGRKWEIRRMFGNRPGYSIIAVDFDQVELVTLAALSGDRRMIRAIQNGEDLHQLTADAANVPRAIGKMTNFLIVYGGGAAELVRRAKMAGFLITLNDAKRVIKAFKRMYPGVGRLQKAITDAFHAGRKYVKTPTGRILPIDRHRVYAGLNYYIQSTARDIMGQGCLNLREAGLWQYVILTVHDEYVAEVPNQIAEEVAAEMAAAVRIENFMNKEINITSGASEPVPTWGSLYDDDNEMEALGLA